MAEIMELQAAVQALRAELMEVRAREQQTQTALATSHAALTSLSVLPDLVQAVSQSTAQLAERSKTSLIDTRGLGRPKALTNSEGASQCWAEKGGILHRRRI